MVNIFQKLFGESTNEQKIKDPVCGMVIDPKTAKATLEKDGKTYYFCSNSCQEQFAGDKKEEKGGHGCC